MSDKEYVLACPDCTGQLFYVLKDITFECVGCHAEVSLPEDVELILPEDWQ